MGVDFSSQENNIVRPGEKVDVIFNYQMDFSSLLLHRLLSDDGLFSESFNNNVGKGNYFSIKNYMNPNCSISYTSEAGEYFTVSLRETAHIQGVFEDIQKQIRMVTKEVPESENQAQ